jgi:glycosyltransferase involved in cell wall biosynthesis
LRIAIATVQVPFINGGAELHTRNLADELKRAGHDVDIITMPFWFSPTPLLEKYEARWAAEDMSVYLAGSIDQVICLKYPTYQLKHPNKKLWLLHPLSSMYDFYGSPYGGDSEDAHTRAFREQLLARDRDAFSQIEKRFTVSHYLATEMERIVDVEFEPLYHPPPNPEVYRLEGSYPFIFAPSRLEEQKRQDVLIRAMKMVDPGLQLVVAGSGGQLDQCRRIARDCGVENRVIFAGDLNRSRIASYYANCFAVYFGPFAEPYGYVTLEAMLSSKPVITCPDSGCPTEFVRHEVNGLVVTPEPEEVAGAINRLWANRSNARAMGVAGRTLYDELGLDWAHVAQKLVN